MVSGCVLGISIVISSKSNANQAERRRHDLEDSDMSTDKYDDDILMARLSSSCRVLSITAKF